MQVASTYSSLGAKSYKSLSVNASSNITNCSLEAKRSEVATENFNRF